MNVNIRTANMNDFEFLQSNDCHTAVGKMKSLIERGRVLITERDDTVCGWLRWGLFWDNTPFMNMLYILEPYRG